MREINIFIALLTAVGAFYVCMSMMFFFMIIFNQTKAYFKWMMLSIALAKFSVAGWALTNAMFLLFTDAVQPIYSLPWRILILFVIGIQIWLVYKIYEGKDIHPPEF